ncbi:uncharacterized protein LOC117511633 isoform X2 [Thalassophryne amazonica]|uniref:uncharacterized protein LOC117511633 isoform X2 n=1 Tax=Thalassophryne amazonica TaxID=390379 RepID=UPI001471E61C|nr:uncharacterized protein LOC117511633 isoform X2 [Thalassophryne amazonica]
MKKLGKEDIHWKSHQAKNCCAYILKTGADLPSLRQAANTYAKNTNVCLQTPNQKRVRVKNPRFDSSSEDEDDRPLLQIKKKKKMVSRNNDEEELARAIEKEMKEKTLAASQEEECILSPDSEDDDELEEKVNNLTKENARLLARNKRLHLALEILRNLPDLLDVVNKLKAAPCSSQHASPAHASTSSSAACSPAHSEDTSGEDVVTLWPGVAITVWQKRLLNAKKTKVKEYTNTLLRMIHTPEVLQSSSLTGKKSNAFKDVSAKKKLPGVEFAIDYIEEQTCCDYQPVRTAITHLLNTEGKRLLKCDTTKGLP